MQTFLLAMTGIATLVFIFAAIWFFRSALKENAQRTKNLKH